MNISYDTCPLCNTTHPSDSEHDCPVRLTDYRALLKKFMWHIRLDEGLDFSRRADLAAWEFYETKFSAEEKAALEDIAEEVHDEYWLENE